jgi:hypothetical protein
MSLLELVKKTGVDRKVQAISEYRRLLARADEATPAEAEELGSIMQFLGKTSDDLGADLRVLASAKRYRQGIADAPALEAARNAANAEADAYRQKFDTVKSEMTRELQRLQIVAEQASAILFEAIQCERRLGEAVRANPDLFEK